MQVYCTFVINGYYSLLLDFKHIGRLMSIVQRNSEQSTCISRIDSTTEELTDKETRGEMTNQTTCLGGVSDICTGDTSQRIRNPRIIASRAFQSHSFKTNLYRSKSETSTDARIGSVDAAQMLITDVHITTTNDTSESMIEPVGGSLTGYAISAPEVDLFDELSSSPSGSGFISAEHFISSLLREEETSPVTSNDATSTLGDTFEVATSSECESSTTDGSDASTVSVATSSQEDAINTRSSSDIDHRHTGFNDSKKKLKTIPFLSRSSNIRYWHQHIRNDFT